MADIDYGKIMALHRAGWNSRMISDEMRMTEEEYQNALTKKLNQIENQIKELEQEYNKFFAVLIGRNTNKPKRNNVGIRRMKNIEILKLLTLSAICYAKDMEIIKSKMVGNKEILDLYTHLPTVQGTYNSIVLLALADSGIDEILKECD